ESPRGGDLVVGPVLGQAHLGAGPGMGCPAFGLQTGYPDIALAAELDDGALGHRLGQRFAMPVLAVFVLVEPAALAGAGDDHRRPVCAGGARERLVDLAEVVPV